MLEKIVSIWLAAVSVLAISAVAFMFGHAGNAAAAVGWLFAGFWCGALHLRIIVERWGEPT